MIITSPILNTPGTRHLFSTRLGGVSTHPHTASMNTAPGHGDDDATVRANVDILASQLGRGAQDVVCTHQIHSNRLRYVTGKNRGEGIDRPAERECDGFYTDSPGVVLMIRTADCAPILLSGLREDSTAAVCAVHAGWRGTVAGISILAAAAMNSMGVAPASVHAAIGPCAHFEAFEVGEDMLDATRAAAGSDFAYRHIRTIDGRLHADVPGMNLELLLSAGLLPENVHVLPYCTISDPLTFHSHRASKGNRGAQGNMIVID